MSTCSLARPSSQGLPSVLDAGERGSAGAAAVSGDHDVVGIGLGYACGYGAHSVLETSFTPTAALD